MHRIKCCYLYLTLSDSDSYVTNNTVSLTFITDSSFDPTINKDHPTLEHVLDIPSKSLHSKDFGSCQLFGVQVLMFLRIIQMESSIKLPNKGIFFQRVLPSQVYAKPITTTPGYLYSNHDTSLSCLVPLKSHGMLAGPLASVNYFFY